MPGMDARHFSPGQDALSKSPADPHGLAGFTGQSVRGAPFLLVTFDAKLIPWDFIPGILPSALRAGFAVRTCSCTCVGQQKKSDSASPRGLASRRRQKVETPAASHGTSFAS